jgi:hypothetical protein
MFKAFVNGLRRVLDIGGVVKDSRVEKIRRKYGFDSPPKFKTIKQAMIADQKALESDWNAVSDDLRKVVPAEYFSEKWIDSLPEWTPHIVIDYERIADDDNI